MNNGSAVKRRREGALERLIKSKVETDRVKTEIKVLQERIASNAKYRKYIDRKPGTPKIQMQASGEEDNKK